MTCRGSAARRANTASACPPHGPVRAAVRVRAGEEGLRSAHHQRPRDFRTLEGVAEPFAVDLPRQVIVKLDGAELPFDVQPFRKYCLLNGFDDIGLTLRQQDKIKAFEANRLATKPWLAHTL